jgi:predicted anti-sigma-YlaC factor YlaD
MGCSELLQLLKAGRWDSEEDIISSSTSIVAHIRSCSSCRRGIARLSEALIAKDMLTCDQCSSRFPAYYEATHPEYPLAALSDVEITEVALHLASCPSCSEVYDEFVRLSILEESGQLDGA